ncbi:MAG: radical SAM protein [Nitrospirae bacterium]|nr:radical SAM protein [Nitrospirota bacterium]
MRLRILLINPWIYDFAAFNLWAKPLGLLRVAEYLSSFDVELLFIDCTDSCTAGRFGAGKYRTEDIPKPDILQAVPRRFKRYGIGTDEFARQVRAAMPFDAVMMTSVMSYWYPGVQAAVEMIRELAGDVPVILGGIYATLYPEHGIKASGADFVFRGPLAGGLNFALATFGFKLKRKREEIPYYRLNLYSDCRFAPLLTSTGCPFRCAYCASELLSGGKCCRRTPDEVLKEVSELYYQSVGQGVRDYAFYDDALLYDADNHIKPILRGIADAGLPVRFHTPNGLHARFVDEEVARLMQRTNFKTVRLSLETTDGDRQEDTGAKVTNSDLEKAVALFRRCGFTKNEIGVYLMYGLPGQELSEVMEGIEFLKALAVKIYLAEFSPVRGTRAWNELVRDGTIDDALDPLLTNNTVFAFLYSGYDLQAVQSLKLQVKAYNGPRLS